MKLITNLLTVDKYYKMGDAELENEAAKRKIKEYGYSSGQISRKIIIDQLIQRDKANNSRIAIFISVIALIISLISLFI